MRLFAVVLALVILALAAVSLAPHAWLAPYAALADANAPWAIAGVAVLLVFTLLVWRPKVAPARTEAPAFTPPAAAPPAKEIDAGVVDFLRLLQEKGRFVDFLMDDIAGYSDAEVGAAGRVLHEGCKVVLREHLGIRPLRDESEGSKVVVPPGYGADEYRLVGRIAGDPPFTGMLVHHGWKADWVKLPRLIGANADRLLVLAPAEVELK